MTAAARIERFVAFSAEATAFTGFELYGTGMADAYLATCDGAVGADVVDRLFDRYDAVVVEHGEGGVAVEELLRRDVLSDPLLGPIARNIAKMWFIGIWYELPLAWTEAYGARELNVTAMVSGTAYTEGLLWPTIGANPPGAKAPGYGTWADPPRIPEWR